MKIRLFSILFYLFFICFLYTSGNDGLMSSITEDEARNAFVEIDIAQAIQPKKVEGIPFAKPENVDSDEEWEIVPENVGKKCSAMALPSVFEQLNNDPVFAKEWKEYKKSKQEVTT